MTTIYSTSDNKDIVARFRLQSFSESKHPQLSELSLFQEHFANVVNQIHLCEKQCKVNLDRSIDGTSTVRAKDVESMHALHALQTLVEKQETKEVPEESMHTELFEPLIHQDNKNFGSNEKLRAVLRGGIHVSSELLK